MVDETNPQNWSVVTGANRGIGLEFTRQLLEAGHLTVACCRNPDEAGELKKLQDTHGHALKTVQLDVSDPESLTASAETLNELSGGVGLLIHNAGIVGNGKEGLSNFQSIEMLKVFQVNLFGPLELTRALLPKLEETSGKVFILTSRTGALRHPDPKDKPGSQFSYPCSKAAVHRLVSLLGTDLVPHGITVGGIDPSWVRTAMTSGGTPPKDRFMLEPSESVKGMLEVMNQVSLEKTGYLWRWSGNLSNWYAPEETAEERQTLPEND
ncbi:MAG: SDR family oxidoreductase [Opitutales bacterium]|nr:SDR family oxidoreductase [Opitutales bacterium]NRA26492.1 SDR family oxidoreductase [Opitutales bacterium]